MEDNKRFFVGINVDSNVLHLVVRAKSVEEAVDKAKNSNTKIVIKILYVLAKSPKKKEYYPKTSPLHTICTYQNPKKTKGYMALYA
jgi:hypothetical protein